MKRSRLILALLLAVSSGACATGAEAQTLRPVVLNVYPPGVARGAATEVTVAGLNDLGGCYRVLVQGGGVTAEPLPAAAEPGKPLAQLRLRVAADADAAPGIREFRLATPRGVSNAGFLVVGEGDEATEAEPNEKPEAAQPLEGVETVNGRLQAAGDRDVFRFRARAGESIAVVALAARVQERMRDGLSPADPVVTLRDAAGRELATADDTNRADPALPYRFERDGEYTLEIRDGRLQGDPSWVYRLTIARRPLVTALFPLAATRGGSVEVQPVGLNVGGLAPVRVELLATMLAPTREVRFGAQGELSAPLPLRVTDQPEGVEREGNDAFGSANSAVFPGGMSGRIGAPFDLDHYRFRAAPGQAWIFEVEAERLGFSLDPQLAVLDGRGTVLAASNDSAGGDPVLAWMAPAEGDFLLQVTDANSRGGEDYCYRLVARPAAPDFSLTVDEDRAQLGPGGSAVWHVRATRWGGFNGEIALAVQGVPEGLGVCAGPIPAGMQDGSIIVSGGAGRPAVVAVTITGTARLQRAGGSPEVLVRTARPGQEYYTAGGNRRLFEVAQPLLCVTGQEDVIVQPATREITLVPGRMEKLEVTITRAPGFKKGVTLDLLKRQLAVVFANPLPPGVSIVPSQSHQVLNEKETKGWIAIQAAPNAPPAGPIPLSVLGQVSLTVITRNVHASAPVYLTVGRK